MRDKLFNHNQVALLATGDEIINGDILNSNSQNMAEQLFANGIRVGLHLSVPDNVNEIQNGLLFLLANHRAVIITGGLGPTSDDLTRYALSHVVNQPLVFDEKIWDGICQRIHSLGYQGPPPEGNRQQALFPKGATIIHNPQGTASGCLSEYQSERMNSPAFIFMLPGPPIECLPMFNTVVLPYLVKNNFQEMSYHEHWLLFGVSEGHIAEKLDALVEGYDCITGYRLFYPYIEFKLQMNEKDVFSKLIPIIEETIRPYIFANGKQPASLILQEKLKESKTVLNIRDLATGGLLEDTIRTPITQAFLNFNPKNSAIEIRGLMDFWENKKAIETQLEIQFPDDAVIKKQIPFRGKRVKQYAVELICQYLCQFIS